VTHVGIVTGAVRGIGAACAARMAETVDVLVLVDLDPGATAEAADELATRSGTRCEAVGADISDPASVADIARTAAGHGTLHRVAHAAGISPTMASWDRMISVDLVGTALLVDALRPLATAGTAIVCVASMAAQLISGQADPAVDRIIDDPLSPTLLEDYRVALGPAAEDPGMAYSWAKRGVRRLVEREAAALGSVGTRICSVSPGTIDTPMGRQEFEQQPAMRQLESIAPLGRSGNADEIAAVIDFLLSDMASFVTGTDVLVDGGVCAAIGHMA
jgi:NAD(P)-dependent dehydrogenase (short-subunit alcohol dehydrogenase family)